MDNHVDERAAAQRPNAAAVLAFVLEVGLLCAAGLWAIEFLPLPPFAAAAAVALPLLVFWGLFMAPRARLRIRWPAHPFVAHGLFATGAVLLHLVDRPVPGWIMLCLTLLSGYLAWRHRRAPRAHGAGAMRHRPDAPEGRRPSGRRAAR
ncbi:YrdB family protein [Arthrobacter halodurans]|uniref:YrdB family protein n=1 Tax=Arthrobacter halodurans TaxID=516699 RepID=A0ABV4UK46_9MICC